VVAVVTADTPPGFYHVNLEFGSGATHRYVVAADSADDALEHIESFVVEEDYPRQAYIVLDVRFVSPFAEML
jgi:hypothetical protein